MPGLIRTIVCALVIAWQITGYAHAQERRFGIIEIGGSGVKASVVDIVTPSRDEGLELRAVRDYPVANVNAVAPERQDAVAAAVGGFVDDMSTRYALTPLQIYVVGSSGLENIPHADALRRAVDQAVAGRAGSMSFVSAADQARFGFEGVLNCERLAHRRAQTLFIDIGSSDITGAAATSLGGPQCGDEGVESFNLNFGVKTTGIAVEERVRQGLAGVSPVMLGRSRVYLGGGIVWALATFSRPDHGDHFVPLSAADIEAFRAQLAADPLCVTDPVMAQRPDPQCQFLDLDFSRVANVDQRVRVSADHREIVTSIYSLEQLRRGADILDEMSQTLGLRGKTVFFARSALRAWAMGLVLTEEAGGAR